VNPRLLPETCHDFLLPNLSLLTIHEKFPSHWTLRNFYSSKIEITGYLRSVIFENLQSRSDIEFEAVILNTDEKDHRILCIISYLYISGFLRSNST
jgi:hypothetical protein